jgi:hypothetical protein
MGFIVCQTYPMPTPRGIKRLEREAKNPTIFSAEVKEAYSDSLYFPMVHNSRKKQSFCLVVPKPTSFYFLNQTEILQTAERFVRPFPHPVFYTREKNTLSNHFSVDLILGDHKTIRFNHLIKFSLALDGLNFDYETITVNVCTKKLNMA